MELSDGGRRVREGVVWCNEGGRQWWVLTHCCLIFIHGWSSLYMDSCCLTWAVVLVCWHLSLCVGSSLHMWAVDVDVVHGCGHVVGSCVAMVVVCIEVS